MTSSRGALDGERPHYEGHRQRLRARLLERGGESLQDYELLEALLFAAIPRRDVKPLAKKLLKESGGSLWDLLHADAVRLHALGMTDAGIALFRVVGAVCLRAHKGVILNRPLLSNWQRVVDYCRAAMAHEKKEQLRLLFLDRKNRLVHEEVQMRGTIDHTPVYPREVVQRALEVGAGALVLCHNHPSGDVSPSAGDISMTREIVAACAPLGIVVHDHIIVGGKNMSSFKEMGLL